MTLTDLIVALFVIATVVFGPLLWREWLDRRAARALALHAAIYGVARRTLGGESFLSVRVAPATPWRPGRVLLSVPTGWEWLIACVWAAVLPLVPAEYELIVKPAGGLAPAPAAVPAFRAAA